MASLVDMDLFCAEVQPLLANVQAANYGVTACLMAGR